MVSELLNTKLLNYTKAVNRPVRQKKVFHKSRQNVVHIFNLNWNLSVALCEIAMPIKSAKKLACLISF